MVLVVASVVLASLAAQATQLQPPTLYRQVFDQTTGVNGYEEYVAAAQMLKDGDFGRQYNEITKLKGNDAWLDSRRDLVDQFPKVMALLRQGNAKPCMDPRTNPNFHTLYPELSYVRNAMRFGVLESEVKLADGKASQWNSSLLETLQFSHNVSGSGTLMAFLVGLAGQGMVDASFAQYMPSLPEPDCKKVVGVCDSLLKKEIFRTILKNELRYITESFYRLADWPDAQKMVETDEESKALAPFLKLGERDRDKVIEIAREAMVRLQAQYFVVLASPESEWNIVETKRTALMATVKDTNARAIIAASSSSVQGAFDAEVKRRTQLRLLRIWGLVQRYKWKTGILPGSLEDLGDKASLLDPASGKPYQYEKLQGGIFRIWSLGNSNTGKISLEPKIAIASVDTPTERSGDIPPD